MVAPLIIGGLISAGASLLGGAMNSAQRRRDAYNNSPAGIRKRAEAAGFNPLVFAGPGTGTGANYAPVMGAAIADAGAAIGGMFADVEAQKLQKARLEMENQRLQEMVERNTLRANVGGIYAGARRGGGEISGAVGAADAGDGGRLGPFEGVHADDVVRGTVPYEGMGGTVIPGPNPETQMGIDEVAGWGALELAAAAWGAASSAYDNYRAGRYSPPVAYGGHWVRDLLGVTDGTAREVAPTLVPNTYQMQGAPGYRGEGWEYYQSPMQ